MSSENLNSSSLLNETVNMNGTRIGSPPCFTLQMFYRPGTFLYAIGCYVFPVVFVIGITGNVLNLIVLNSRGMRAKTNYFLSAMAVADLCFLLVMFMINLLVYPHLALSESFMKFYVLTRTTFTASANVLSSSSIWFAVLVTIERLVAIRTPLHAKMLWKSHRVIKIIVAIVVLSIILNLYNFFWLKAATMPNCSDRNRTVYYLMALKPNNANTLKYKYVQASQIIGPILQVTFPLILLVVLNSSLLYYLRMNRKSISRMSQSTTQKATGNNKEWKITTTVLLIVFSFILFNCPSAIFYYLTTHAIITMTPLLHNFVYFANFLVFINKAMNFVLYCTSSASFRRRLIKLFKRQQTFYGSVASADDEIKEATQQRLLLIRMTSKRSAKQDC